MKIRYRGETFKIIMKSTFNRMLNQDFLFSYDFPKVNKIERK